MVKPNTVEKALKLLESKIGADSDEYKRTLRVLECCESWAEDLEMTGRQTEILLMASCLINIGSTKDVLSHGFEPYDGYKYLRLNRWDSDVCLLVLHKCNAKQLSCELELSPDVIEAYSEPLPEHLESMNKILTLVEFSTSNSGERVTIDERVNELEEQFKASHIFSNHYIELSYEVAAWALDLRFRN